MEAHGSSFVVAQSLKILNHGEHREDQGENNPMIFSIFSIEYQCIVIVQLVFGRP